MRTSAAPLEYHRGSRAAKKFGSLWRRVCVLMGHFFSSLADAAAFTMIGKRVF